MEETKDSYFMVHSFMTSGLKLSGTELLTFALIYSFACSEERCFRGSLSYITERTGASLRAVNYALRSLLDKGFITKQRCEKGVGFIYRIDDTAVGFIEAKCKNSMDEAQNLRNQDAKIADSMRKNCVNEAQNLQIQCAKIAPNNKEDNKYYNKADNSAHGGARGEANKNFNGNGGYNGGYYGNGYYNGRYNKKNYYGYDDGKDAAYWDEVFAYVLARSEEDDDDEVEQAPAEQK
jgi:DNA-binding MarR family transcriptional regulator